MASQSIRDKKDAKQAVIKAMKTVKRQSAIARNILLKHYSESRILAAGLIAIADNATSIENVVSNYPE
jgi:hypothetical protein